MILKHADIIRLVIANHKQMIFHRGYHSLIRKFVSY